MLASPVSLMVLALCCLAQASHHIPSKKDLCGLLVDTELQKKCLKCFTDAGSIEKHPEKVRQCVGTYLPPVAADCSVPHVEMDEVRINQGKPDVHHNHTNANLLPNCLKRKMRFLSRYLKSEIRFTSMAGRMVKSVVVAKFVKHGGPAMLSAQAMKSILAMPKVKSLVENDAGAQLCLDKYRDKNGNCEIKQRADIDADMLLTLLEEEEIVEEDFDEVENEEEEEEYDGEETEDENDEEEEDNEDDQEEEEEYDDEEQEEEEEEEEEEDGDEELYQKDSLQELRKKNQQKSSSVGNDLPFSGTNCLARVALLGDCLISAMTASGSAKELLSIMRNDTFFYPIPEWWVGPLLNLAQEISE